ncbi:iron chelate uptake ABC transporter family permease subunit [Nanchangia anserum]|uniref:iron chelate uptake ABC transporter family permease subunit n=1 Tax=Nanchangia anserum TaxID=2692125 RepID=UPI001D119D75|nr:iron chelate uptake ABC transporter family permease subunit [Nanchangia anserum]
MTSIAPTAPRATSRPLPRHGMRRDVVALALACIAVFILFTWSLATGTASLSLIDLVRGTADADQIRTFALSRLPRTLAVVLAGASMAMAGLIMQMLVRNRYVEPSTTGVTESASLGILVVTIVAPQAQRRGQDVGRDRRRAGGDLAAPRPHPGAAPTATSSSSPSSASC